MPTMQYLYKNHDSMIYENMIGNEIIKKISWPMAMSHIKAALSSLQIAASIKNCNGRQIL